MDCLTILPMKKRYLCIIAFPVVAISIATMLVSGIGVLISDGEPNMMPSHMNRGISLLIGIMIMSILYSIPAFKRWIPNKRNLGKQVGIAFVAFISTCVVGEVVYTNVVNDAFHWTASPAWLDGRRVLRGMCLVVMVAWWVFKNPSRHTTEE